MIINHNIRVSTTKKHCGLRDLASAFASELSCKLGFAWPWHPYDMVCWMMNTRLMCVFCSPKPKPYGIWAVWLWDIEYRHEARDSTAQRWSSPPFFHQQSWDIDVEWSLMGYKTNHNDGLGKLLVASSRFKVLPPNHFPAKKIRCFSLVQFENWDKHTYKYQPSIWYGNLCLFHEQKYMT